MKRTYELKKKGERARMREGRVAVRTRAEGRWIKPRAA
jgi:hypothetical protein